MKKILILLLGLTTLFAFISCTGKKAGEKVSAAPPEEIHVLYMAQAAYQPADVEGWAKIFTDITGIKVNVDFVKYDEQTVGEMLDEMKKFIADIKNCLNIWL